MVRLQHRTQRGGEITHTGPPVPSGETAVLPVDENGIFEAPAALAAELQRILGADTIKPAPVATTRKRRESDE